MTFLKSFIGAIVITLIIFGLNFAFSHWFDQSYTVGYSDVFIAALASAYGGLRE